MFDQLNIASDAKQRYFNIKNLESDIASLKQKCGSCEHWMKKSECNAEAKGIKVSCGHSICIDFKMDKFSSDLIDRKTLEIKNLK